VAVSAGRVAVLNDACDRDFRAIGISDLTVY
jgi:hypothetical protein